MSQTLEIEVFDRQHDVNLDPILFTLPHLAHTVLEQEKERARYLSIAFVSDSSMRRLHKKLFQDSSSTDCISVPLDPKEEPLRHLGEIIVCPLLAKRYTEAHGGNLYEEIALYIIHSLLHLLGYSDKTKKERALMRKREGLALSSFLKKQVML